MSEKNQQYLTALLDGTAVELVKAIKEDVYEVTFLYGIAENNISTVQDALKQLVWEFDVCANRKTTVSAHVARVPGVMDKIVQVHMKSTKTDYDTTEAFSAVLQASARRLGRQYSIK
jgi:hypothetical protein